MIEHRLRLRDGRILAAAEVGDPAGVPVVYAHGFPGSRLGVELAAEAAERAGLRAIGFDRPGWGASDALSERTLADWPGDVAAAMDRLDCARFHLLGVSGGAPFTLACAAALPDRVGRVAITCGLGPPEAMRVVAGMVWHNRLGLEAVRRASWLAAPAACLAAPLLPRMFDSVIASLARHGGPADRRVLSDPRVLAVLERDFLEGFRAGGAGAAADARIYANPWGIGLDAIRAPVFLWHGEKDRVVPVGMARWLAQRLPRVTPVYDPSAGHFSVVIDRLEEIAAVLAVDVAC